MADRNGFYGVAVYHPKSADNVGTLWRTATSYGAAFVATVGRRYRHQASDTSHSTQSMPLFHHTDMADLVAHLAHGAPLVGVELADRAVPLAAFTHPDRALYLLGAEDHGLPPAVLDRCHEVVRIPTPRPLAQSLNLAVAGALVMADRYAKSSRPEVRCGQG